MPWSKGNCNEAWGCYSRFLVQSKKLNIRKCDDILNQFSEFTTSDAVGVQFWKVLSMHGLPWHPLIWCTVTRKEIPQVVWGCEETFAIITWSCNGGMQLLCQQGCFRAQPPHIVKDQIHHVGGLLGVVITKELLNSAQRGRQRYHVYLEERKTEKERYWWKEET